MMTSLDSKFILDLFFNTNPYIYIQLHSIWVHFNGLDPRFPQTQRQPRAWSSRRPSDRSCAKSVAAWIQAPTYRWLQDMDQTWGDLPSGKLTLWLMVYG